jgi:hypothetical protein
LKKEKGKKKQGDDEKVVPIEKKKETKYFKKFK